MNVIRRTTLLAIGNDGGHMGVGDAAARRPRKVWRTGHAGIL